MTEIKREKVSVKVYRANRDQMEDEKIRRKRSDNGDPDYADLIEEAWMCLQQIAQSSVPNSEQMHSTPFIPTGLSDIFGKISEDERNKIKQLLRILRSGRQDACQGIIWNLEWADSWLDRQEENNAGTHDTPLPLPQIADATKGRRSGKSTKTG